MRDGERSRERTRAGHDHGPRWHRKRQARPTLEDAIVDELTDRYGEPPTPVRNLLAVAGAFHTSIMEPARERLAAALAGVAAFQLADDPARQLRGLALPGIAAPAPADRFDETEQDLLLRAGISTVTIDADGTVRLDRVVTTHGAAGDTARPWLDIMVPKTLSRIRWDWASYVSQLYPRHKLADDGSPAAVATAAVVTPRRMHGSWAARCQLYEREGWIEGAAETVAQSRFERDASDRNRMNASQQVRVIGNLIVLAAALEFQV